MPCFFLTKYGKKHSIEDISHQREENLPPHLLKSSGCDRHLNDERYTKVEHYIYYKACMRDKATELKKASRLKNDLSPEAKSKESFTIKNVPVLIKYSMKHFS